MANNHTVTSEKMKPDVAGALQKIRAKKSPEQIKAERFLPFIPVIAEALGKGWSWSSILMLIREHGGPSLTKREAEALYARLKGGDALSDNSDGGMPPVDVSKAAPQAGAAQQGAD